MKYKNNNVRAIYIDMNECNQRERQQVFVLLKLTDRI